MPEPTSGRKFGDIQTEMCGKEDIGCPIAKQIIGPSMRIDQVSLPSLLASFESGEWRLGIGDPTPIGWLTVFAYLVAAIVCGRVALVPQVGIKDS